MAEQSNGDGADVAKGLMFVHNAIGQNIVQTQQLSAQLYAMTEALVSKGVISLHVLEERRQAISEQMMSELPEKWTGARMLADETDKYETRLDVKVDCSSRLHLCKAACCRLGFYLSRQDLEEGHLRWDFARPYHIAQSKDGYCVHCDSQTLQCNVRDHRPIPCRSYDCHNDKRIWSDFEKMEPNPALAELKPIS